MSGYLEDNHMSLLNFQVSSTANYFHSQYAVFQNSSNTTNLGVVFDVIFKTTCSISVNNILLLVRKLNICHR